MSNQEQPKLTAIQGEGHGPPHHEMQNWRQMGHCAAPGIPASVMAPAADNLEGIERAKALCVGCIVTKRCLEYGLNIPEHIDFGIWGGTTPEQRVIIRTVRAGIGPRHPRGA